MSKGILDKQIISVDVDLGNAITVMNATLKGDELFVNGGESFDNFQDAFDYIINITYIEMKPRIIIDGPNGIILLRMINDYWKNDITKMVEVEMVKQNVFDFL